MIGDERPARRAPSHSRPERDAALRAGLTRTTLADRRRRRADGRLRRVGRQRSRPATRSAPAQARTRRLSRRRRRCRRQRAQPPMPPLASPGELGLQSPELRAQPSSAPPDQSQSSALAGSRSQASGRSSRSNRRPRPISRRSRPAQSAPQSAAPAPVVLRRLLSRRTVRSDRSAAIKRQFSGASAARPWSPTTDPGMLAAVREAVERTVAEFDLRVLAVPRGLRAVGAERERRLRRCPSSPLLLEPWRRRCARPG